MTIGWRKLEELARAETEATLAALPAPLQARARALPVTYEDYPSPALQDDGIEADTLGLFVGESFTEEGHTMDPLPAQIILFLDNLWDEAEGDADRYRQEIRTTLLHELGHYLGLEEGDLTTRGLE